MKHTDLFIYLYVNKGGVELLFESHTFSNIKNVITIKTSYRLNPCIEIINYVIQFSKSSYKKTTPMTKL